MRIKNKWTLIRGDGGGEIIQERRGRVKSRNMYKRPMDEDNGSGKED